MTTPSDGRAAPVAAVEELKALLGPRGWLEGDDAAPFVADVFGHRRGPAALVVRPASTREVASVVTICRRHAMAIVPQGGNTGLCGGAVPVAGGAPCIVLSLARMNRIVSIDPLRFTVTAEAGCIVQTIQEAAAEVDRSFALDWGARGSAMLGGAISTNAGGINVLRFGNTREQVLGLEVVLPDGRIWNGLRALRKDSSGYDLKQLFIGAEGTLGIVTRAVMRLHPRAPREQTMFASVGDFGRLMELFALARSVGDAHLSAFELIPGRLIELALARHRRLVRPIETRAEWNVLVRFSGGDDIADLLERLFAEAFERGLLTDAALAGSLAQERNLWELRDEITPMRLMTGKMLKWDASLPIDCIVAFLTEAEARARAIHADLEVIAFGHVGDGNLHLSIWPDGTPGDPVFDRRCEHIVRAVDELVWAYGGSVSAEHGVGADQCARVRQQKPPIEFEMMAKIKALLDPDALLNPGKIFGPASAPARPAD
ncbi:MAG: FAD-binding oxidoreductase [Gammaproteobacteria bacterium]|nr:FAD-binding oxidoreductase [Gammaproteobacteria bacterium]MBU2288895.1 FAD-binding oxidoreductase [Gammaproteobacteria bacterium]